MGDLKSVLYKELELKNNISVEGIQFDPEIFREELEKNKHLALSHNCMDFSLDDTKDIIIPAGGRTAHGIGIGFNKNSSSPYALIKEENQLFIVKDAQKLVKLQLVEPAKYQSKKTSDGTLMKTIAMGGGGLEYGNGQITIAYSNECALIEKGKDCLFCNINATKARFAEKECIQWKNPIQISETVKAAYEEGFNHLTLTGGFIPERREVEYYIDAAEKITDILGTATFNGTACIGAPVDLSVLEKYKEAGFDSVGLNMEVWNRHFFEAICPGKSEVCGGYDHWVDAIDYAIQVFGKGNVRSNFVAGLEPKEYLLEGIQTLAEKGVVATSFFPWIPNIGSKFEGHRTPTAEWHWDVQQKIYRILRNSGITYENVYNATPGTMLLHEFYKVEDELLPVFNRKSA